MTKVVFRKFKGGDIIAIFPRIPADRLGHMCESYMHVGQHGSADPSIVSITKPATPSEYRSLLQELKTRGYDDLTIGKKITYEDQVERMRLARK